MLFPNTAETAQAPHHARLMREFYDYKKFISPYVRPLHDMRQAHLVIAYKVRVPHQLTACLWIAVNHSPAC